MNEITEKWQETGLLEELDDFLKTECANSLEETADIIMDESDVIKEIDDLLENPGFFAGTIIPIVRRIYSDYPDKAPTMNIRWLIEDFKAFVKQNTQLFRDLNSTPACDGEAEFVCFYVKGLQGQL